MYESSRLIILGSDSEEDKEFRSYEEPTVIHCYGIVCVEMDKVKETLERFPLTEKLLALHSKIGENIEEKIGFAPSSGHVEIVARYASADDPAWDMIEHVFKHKEGKEKGRLDLEDLWKLFEERELRRRAFDEWYSSYQKELPALLSDSRGSEEMSNPEEGNRLDFFEEWKRNIQRGEKI